VVGNQNEEMPMLSEAKDELTKFEECMTRTDDLRIRFEGDFDKLRNESFNIPKKEGSWESFTTNRPSSDAYKVINTLASARLKLWIPLTDEDERKRKNLSKTERFPYGAIALRDSLMGNIPEALPLQAELSWHAPMRGWIGLLCYLYEEDDGKNGTTRPHIAVWDILNSAWISGSNGLLWAGYKRFASKEDIKAQYKEDVKSDSKGRVEVYDIWDTEQEGVITEGEYLEKKEHGCDHVPVLILPGGSTPFIQSGDHEDTIKNVGESIYVNNRHMFDIESRIGSYFLTMTGRAAKTPLYFLYDSTKGGLPPDMEGNPFEKGAVVPIDVGRGQKIEQGITSEMTRDTYAFWEYLQGRLGIGGMTPVSFGEINQALPAAGINMLRHASMDSIKPPQKLMERTYVWLAHELVSQYKNGDFEKMEIQGMDGSNRRFKMDVKPSDIDDSWNFEASLIADFPQDEMANMGMAVQAVESELMSRQTARDKYGLVDDTDQEQQILDREKAFRVAAVQLRKIARALAEDGDFEGAQYILDEIETMQMQKKGVASQPGMPSPVRPSADTSAAVPQPPEAGGIRKFFNRFGVG